MNTRLPLSRQRRSNRAFTLMEIMIVIIIIGLLVTLAASQLVNIIGTGEETKVKADIRTYELALKMYKAKSGRYPTTAQGLKALQQKPSSPPVPARWQQYMKDVVKDPWQQDYQYAFPGKHNAGSFDIWSMGADPDNPSDDIGNWNQEN